jgi:hypothetical protein
MATTVSRDRRSFSETVAQRVSVTRVAVEASPTSDVQREREVMEFDNVILWLAGSALPVAMATAYAQHALQRRKERVALRQRARR